MLRLIMNKRDNLIVIGSFLIFLVIQFVILTSGLAWVQLEVIQFNFWMPVFVAVLASVAGIVATYSFVSYTQEGCFRSFIFTLVGINMVLLAFLYLLTHPAASWSAFSDRSRNMTITAAIGILVTPGVLAGSFVGDKSMTRQARNITILFGVIVQPLVSLWLFFSPEPLFALTGPDMGIGILTIHGWLLTIIIGITSFIALGRYLHEWMNKHERIVLATGLALVLWILSFLIYLVIDSPLQIAELLWFSGLGEGFALLAIAMILTAIIDPHRALETLVQERTKQLDESREESEFYLSLWTHKIGNLLQGIVMYLELIGYKLDDNDDLSTLRKSATELVIESVLVNRQVERLIQIKEKSSSTNWPICLDHVLHKSVNQVKEILGDENFSFVFPESEQSPQIIADDLVDIVFVNLMSRCARQQKATKSKMTVVINQTQDIVRIALEPCRIMQSSTGQNWSLFRPTLQRGILDLDLYIAGLLMEKYGGKIEYGKLPDSNEERLLLTFKGSLTKEFSGTLKTIRSPQRLP